MTAAACRRNRDELKTVAPLSRKSLGQRSVEDGRRGTFDNEELVFHRETPPEADIRTEAAMEMKDLAVQKGPTTPVKETGWPTHNT